MDAARFVFLDETGLTTKMTRLYGRSRRGERLVVRQCPCGTAPT